MTTKTIYCNNIVQIIGTQNINDFWNFPFNAVSWLQATETTASENMGDGELCNVFKLR